MRVLGLCFAALLILQNVSADKDKPDFPNDLYYHHHPHKVKGHYVDTNQKVQPVKEASTTTEFSGDTSLIHPNEQGHAANNGPQPQSPPNQAQGQPQNLAQAPPPEASTNTVAVNMAVDANGGSPAGSSSTVSDSVNGSQAPSGSAAAPPAAQSSTQSDEPAITYNADGGIVLPDSAGNTAGAGTGAVPPSNAQSSTAPVANVAPAANAAPAVNAAPVANAAAAPPAPPSTNSDGSPVTYDDNGAIIWPEKPSTIAGSVAPAAAAAVPAAAKSPGYPASRLAVDPESLPLHASTRRSRFTRILLADADNTHDGTDFMGLGTFFDLETRAGECGEKHKNTDLVAALNVEQMGNDKKECNKEIEVMGPNEKKVRVKVVDVCKTCKKGDLDLSPKAFEALGEFGLGEVSIKWHFV